MKNYLTAAGTDVPEFLQLLGIRRVVERPGHGTRSKPHSMTGIASAAGIAQLGLLGRSVGGLVLLVSVTACETVPTAQLKSFSDSLAAVQDANKPIFADLALAEGATASNRPDPCPNLHQIAVPGGTPIRNGFCLSEAATTAGHTDPPDTAAFKAGMKVLQIYANTLATLASGGSTVETSAQLAIAANNLQAIGATLTGSIAPTVAGAIKVLAPLIDQAATQLSKAEARRLVLTGNKQAHDIIVAERNSVPAIWDTVTADLRRQLLRINPKDIEGAAALRAKIETYRTIMSNYAAMLDRLDAAWTKTVAATNSPQPETLADLAALTDQLKIESDVLAKTYAELRAIPAT